MKFAVTSTSAISEPRTAATTTTTPARFPNGAAFGACGMNCRRRRDCWNVYASVLVKDTNTIIHYHKTLLWLRKGVSKCYFMLELTFASLQTLGPPVINVPVARTTAFLEPSTAGSATTNSAGFRECAALRARHRVSNHRSDGWRGGWGGDRCAGY